MNYHITELFVLGAFLLCGITVDILAAGGNLDASFNGSGKSVFNIESVPAPGGTARFEDIAVIGGNKFLIIGRAEISPSYYAVTLSRYNSDGSLDTSFGAGGRAVTDTGITSEGTALAVQSDGKIVVTGSADNYPDRKAVVLRFMPDGMLDTTFANNGITFVPLIFPKDIEVLADDKILITGVGDVPNSSLEGVQVAKLNANGSADTSFGNNGIASSTYSGYGSNPDEMEIQTDGKIVISGGNYYNVVGVVHRFNSDGSPDTTFETGGVREIPGPNNTRMYFTGGVAILPDGKILLAGAAKPSSSDFTAVLLMRLNSDGSSDTSFGTQFGMIFHELTPGSDGAEDMKLQNDGKVVISGYRDTYYSLVARFDSTGALDPGFGGSGGGVAQFNSFSRSATAIALQGSNIITVGRDYSDSFLARLGQTGAILSYRIENFLIGKNDQVRDVAVQPDGKIVSAGISVNGNGLAVVSVARLLSNGSLDSTFGTGGRVALNEGLTSSEAYTLDIQPDGKIVVAGRHSPSISFSSYSLFVARLNTDGSLDSTFGTGGKAVITMNGRYLLGYDIELLSDGKIVVGGTVERFVGDGITEYDMMAARLNPNGTLDGGFGSGGIFIYLSGSPSALQREQAKALSIQPDGKIVLAGTHLLRLNAEGTVDSSFSPTPIRLSFPATDIELQPDGKMVLGGSMNSDFALARYNSNASIDASFGINGTAALDFGGTDFANAIYLDANGDILAGGSTFGGSIFRGNFALARFKPNGSPDSGFGSGGKVVTDFGGDAQIFGLTRQNDGKIVAAGHAKVSLDRDYALARYFSRTAQFDFDGDAKADVSVFRPENGTWYLQQSANGFTGFQFGLGTDKIVPADYDGDGVTDVAVFRSGAWYLQRSQFGFTGISFGASEDIPVPADYDGDGKADLAVFRPSNGTWYLQRSQAGFTGIQFGVTGDKPVPADYDGDGKADIAVYRAGMWYVQRSQLGFTGIQFGLAGDKPVPADYDGDGKADVAVFRSSNGTWYLQRSQLGFTGIQFGAATDAPAPADYDGDGRTDVAVFRSGTWYLNRSTAGFTGVAFGSAGDKAVPNAFVP